MKYLDSPPLNRIKTPDQVLAIPRPVRGDSSFNRYYEDGKLDEPATYYAWKNATCEWLANFVGEKEKAMDQCKALFEKLQDAVSTVLIYEVGYERAKEGIGFSYRQIEKARSALDLIKDELNDNLAKIKNATDENMKENQELSSEILAKKDKLASFAQVLNDLSDSVLELNEWWDGTPVPSVDFPY